MLTLTLTIALTLLTLMVTVSGNPTNPTTKYRCEFDNLNCILPNKVILNKLFSSLWGPAEQCNAMQ